LLRAKEALSSGHDFLYQKSDYAKAIFQFETSRNLFAEAGNVCEAAIAANWVAQLLPDVGKIAESRLRLASIIANAESRQFKILLPPAYYWLAIADYWQAHFSDSNRNFKTALRLAEATNNSFEIHHATEVLALNYSRLGELEPALSYASRMLSARGVYYESQTQSLRDLGTLADLTLRWKLFSTSLNLSRERLDIALETEPDSSRVNDSLRHMVNAAAGGGDFASALDFARQSMEVALKRPDSRENTRTIAEIYLLLGDIKSKTGHCNDALNDYDKALELFGRLPEITDRPYQIYKGRLFCFQQLGRRLEFANEFQTALNLSESYRATIREDTTRQAFFANEQDVFDAAVTNAIAEGDSGQAFALVEQSRARSLLSFVASDRPIAELEKNFAPVSHSLSLREIQARLPEQVQVVQYAVLADKLAIWILTRTRFSFIEKRITAEELDQRIGDYQAALIGKAPPAELNRSAMELYALLIPTDLAPDKQICVVPDKSLHQLAFASLVSPGGRYLLEEHVLFYAPSASLLVIATGNAKRKERFANESVLSVGNPDFDREENQNLSDLRSAEVEARNIARNYEKSVELFGAEATSKKFLDNLTAVHVIHFAGHFVANRQSPANSKLLLAGSELRSSELGTYKLTMAKLVVLSACKTGFERYDKSEGAIGIARTFLALGAPIVVASQWMIDSDPTTDQMIAFHRNRKVNHLSSAESLRQAQLETLRNSQTKSPYYWAAFSLFGGYASY
jgi:CHAT domain-containing protein